MHISKKFKVDLLIFLIFGTLFLGIMPILQINSNSEILKNDDDDNKKIFFTPKLQQAFDPEEWWNYSWTFRVNVNVTANGTFTLSPINYTNRLVETNINFTELLHNQSDFGAFDENSIRIIEYNSTGNIIGEVPSQFDEGTGYNANSKAIGELSWILNGTTNAANTRYYFIYFDSVPNGPKPAPNYNLGLSLTENSPTFDYTLENNEIKISMDLNIAHGGYYDHVYEVINKHSGRDQQLSTYNWGWMLYSWTYGGYSDPDGHYNGVTRIEVVSDGPIKKTVKMVQEHSNFIYERYYTVNYLDNTVNIKHKITCLSASGISQGNWYFASWWTPGYGGTNRYAPNSAYGMGGYDFSSGAAPMPTLGDEFTDAEHLTSEWGSGWRTFTNPIKDQSWFVHWNNEPGIPNRYEGVGTVWDNYDVNHTQLYSYGYNTGASDEGRSIYIRYLPRALALDQSFEFNVWGIIFNGTDGTYVKERADALQESPLISSIGGVQPAGKSLTIHAQDIDNKLIEGAELELYNVTSGVQLIDNKTTNSIGNITFTGLCNDSDYEISAYYRVNETRFWINNLTVNIALPFLERKVYRVLDSNLTTVNILGTDYNTGYKLYEVYMKILNSSSGDCIIEEPTNVDGWISVKLPADMYNLTTFYQGVLEDFEINSSGVVRTSLQFSLVNETDYNASLHLTNEPTSLTIESTSYSKESQGWIHNEEVSSQPFYIKLYINDTVNVTVHYKIRQTSIAITGATTTWNLSLDDSPENSSNALTFTEIGLGNYSFKLYSGNYDPGLYSIKVNLSKRLVSVQDAIIYIGFEIYNHTSVLQKIDTGSNLNVYWNQNVTLFLNYTTVLPEIVNISQATVNYSVIGKNINGTMDNVIGSPGRSYLEFNTTTLAVGTYDLYLFANKTDINMATKTISFTVKEIPTLISWDIDNNYEVTSTFLKIARGESTSIIVNYSVDPTGKYIGASNCTSALIINTTNVLNENFPSEFLLDDLLNGLYSLTIDANQFSAGDYEITFIGYDEHHEVQMQTITLRILDSWATKVDLIKPPSFYPWSNNASFVVNYYCTEDPRTNRLLSGAAINTLNISIKVGQTFQPYIELGVVDRGTKWDYFDLESDPLYGAGYYLIWFNTSYANVSESTAYYVSPTLQKEFYSTYTYNPYVWVRPVFTVLTPISDKVSIVPVKIIEFYLDQSSEIIAIYNVSDSISDLDGQLINGATITCEIRNNTPTNELIKTGSFTPISAVQNPGEYKYTLEADLLGNFTLSITAVKEDYSEGIASIDFFVDTKPINYTLSENIRGTVFFTPQNREVSITLSLIDIVHSASLSGATIEVTFEGQSYLFHESSTSGVYAITFNNTMLAEVVPDQTYTVQIKMVKTNYTTQEVILSLDIGLPVDPFLGIPYLYWLLIGTTIAVVVGIYGTTKYIKYRRIPEFTKKLNKVKKAIKSKKTISESLATETKMEYMLNSLGARWDKLGISLEDLLGIKGKKLGEIKKESIEPEIEEEPPEPEIEYPEPEIEEEPPEPEIEYPEPEIEEEPSEPEIEYPEPEIEEEPSEPEIEYPEPEIEEEPPEPEIEYPEPKIEEEPPEPEIEEEPPKSEWEYPEPEKEPSEKEKEYDENQEGGSEE